MRPQSPLMTRFDLSAGDVHAMREDQMRCPIDKVAPSSRLWRWGVAQRRAVRVRHRGAHLRVTDRDKQRGRAQP
jgi:hypothetical protein